MKRKILITGAAGFIGGHLYDECERLGWEVIGIDNFSHPSEHPKNGRVKYADIRYYHDIEPFVKEVDVVAHLAAQIHVDKSILNPQETIDTNVTGTLNVLEAVRVHNKHMVFASSSEVYGTSQAPFISELHPLDAQSPYAASKVAGDRLCLAYYHTYGTKVSILRNFNTFGPYQNDASYGGVIAIFTKKALENDTLNIFGSGDQRRDYMHVKDAVRAYLFCVEKELWGEPINIGTGQTITINELAKEIVSYTNSKSDIQHTVARPGEVQRLCADTTKAVVKGFVGTTDFIKDLHLYIDFCKAKKKGESYEETN